jgi:hypothetical protein
LNPDRNCQFFGENEHGWSKCFKWQQNFCGCLSRGLDGFRISDILISPIAIAAMARL